jgi:hypothetical protein
MSITGTDRAAAGAGDLGAADASASGEATEAAPAPAVARGGGLRIGAGGDAAGVAWPGAGQDHGAWAAGAADALRHAPDAQKTAILNQLESLGNSGSHDDWAAVYDNQGVVGALAGVVHETLDPTVQSRATSFLLKVYQDHFDDDGDYSSGLKNTATDGLADAFGSEVTGVVLRATGDEQLARAISDRAEQGIHNPEIEAGENAPFLQSMGIDGSGTRVMVIDQDGSDHMAHTTFLASPALSGAQLMPYGCQNMSGRPFLQEIARALDQAKQNGVNVVSISAGITWEGRDRDDYMRRAGGDEKKARAEYDQDLAQMQGLIDAFPGVVVVAAGNDGAGGQPNDLARSPNVIVADALDPSERSQADFDSPAHHPENVLGVGTSVWAPGAGGDMQFIEDATSWAAPQVAHFATCVFQAGRQFDQSIDPGEVREIMKRTAEPVEGAERADVVAAVRFAKTLAYAKSTGDGSLVSKLWALPPDRARAVASEVEPMLHDLGPRSGAAIAAAIGRG